MADARPMPFDLQPTLVGQLLELRPLRPADGDDLYAVASDPLIWEQHPDRERHRPDVFAAFFREGLASGGALAVTDRRDRRLIGSSRYHGHDTQRSEIEIGWTFLARSHWGGRFNRELKQLMLRHAFRFVDNVIFVVGTENLRSRRAVEKIGGVLVEPGHARAAADKVVYRITAEAFRLAGGCSGSAWRTGAPAGSAAPGVGRPDPETGAPGIPK